MIGCLDNWTKFADKWNWVQRTFILSGNKGLCISLNRK